MARTVQNVRERLASNSNAAIAARSSQGFFSRVLKFFGRRERRECKADFDAMARTVQNVRERLASNSNAAIAARSSLSFPTHRLRFIPET
jgi:hypothetical protein